MAECYNCGEYIQFDDWHVSKSGKKIPLDPNGEPHDCSDSNSYENPTCKHCDEEITFDPEITGRNGKMIPLDPDTDKPHRCEQSLEAWKKAHPLKCQYCNIPIFFSDKNMSVGGKHIPMEVETGENHNCPERPYVTRKMRDYRS